MKKNYIFSFLCGFLCIFLVLFCSSSSGKKIQHEPAPRSQSLVSQIAVNIEAYRGKTITIEGSIRALEYTVKNGHSFEIRQPVCTLLACSNENPCCNGCYSQASITDDENFDFALALRGSYLDKKIECIGNDCSMQCNPPFGRYRVQGVISLEGEGNGFQKAILSVNKIDPL